MTKYWKIALSVAILFLIGAREWTLLPDGKLHLHFLSIGQGDSTLITLPDHKQILIDGGVDWKPLEKLGAHVSFFDRSIDLLILTHDNADHLMALPEIAKRYRIRAILIGGYGASGRYTEILRRLETQGTKIVVATAGSTFTMDDVRIEVLWPPSQAPSSLVRGFNDVSIVAKILYKNNSALFTGDIESVVEETLVRTRADLSATVLKVAHHGSRTSSTEAFLRRVHPDVAVISSGEGNRYGHPHPEIVERLQNMGIEVHRTDTEGDIEIVW